MTMETMELLSTDKSSGAELLACDAPAPDWGVDQLSEYARDQNQRIAVSEQTLTPLYWNLGLALELAKKNFNHGQWTAFLDQCGISKARAARARAIHGSFPSENEVQSLSVEQAYAQRKRKATKPAKAKPQLIADDELADKQEAFDLLAPTREAMNRLAMVQSWLQQQTADE